VDLGLLISSGVAPTQARLFAPALGVVMMKWGIAKTPTRQAMFLAQAMWESDKFRRLEEDLWYRDAARACTIFSALDPATAQQYMGNPQKLANKVYADRMGNGNEASGDGWKFRGRGIFQLTGRDGYHRAAMGTGRPYESIPDMVATVTDACTTAAWYWTVTGCNVPADAGNFDGVTRKINPAMAGASGRRTLYTATRAAFASASPDVILSVI
jgi:putative chitinase